MEYTWFFVDIAFGGAWKNLSVILKIIFGSYDI